MTGNSSADATDTSIFQGVVSFNCWQNTVATVATAAFNLVKLAIHTERFNMFSESAILVQVRPSQVQHEPAAAGCGGGGDCAAASARDQVQVRPSALVPVWRFDNYPGWSISASHC